MKLIFVFLSFIHFINPVPLTKITSKSTLINDYQLRDKKIVKQMAEPIEITNQGPNLLVAQAYENESQLELPPEDLKYIRSNQVAVDFSFSFQLEWWNDKEHQIMTHPQIIQSIKSADLMNQPSQVVMRLNWPSAYIKPQRPFAHLISFSYSPEFNLILKQQLHSDLSQWELKAIANESCGVPQHYRIRLSEICLSYPVPAIFYNLQTKFVVLKNSYSPHQKIEWWSDFSDAFFESGFFTSDHFDDFFERPQAEQSRRKLSAEGENNPSEYRSLNLIYKNFDYLKIYQLFFPRPRIRITYRQHLDLTSEFNQTTLRIEPQQDIWETFKQAHIEWLWWLNYVKPTLEEESLTLESKNLDLVKGFAKIKIIREKRQLSNLALITNFDYLQIADEKELETEVFNLFKKKNSAAFANENMKNYQLVVTKNSLEFVLTALNQATFQGGLNLIFKTIKVTQNHPLATKAPEKTRASWPIWNWFLLGISIISLAVLIILKFLKSKLSKSSIG